MLAREAWFGLYRSKKGYAWLSFYGFISSPEVAQDVSGMTVYCSLLLSECHDNKVYNILIIFPRLGLFSNVLTFGGGMNDER
jgi:hypothetical protein